MMMQMDLLKDVADTGLHKLPHEGKINLNCTNPGYPRVVIRRNKLKIECFTILVALPKYQSNVQILF